MVYDTRWVCRRDPFPEHVLRSFTNMREEIYTTMQEPEWNVTGNLKNWDVTDGLGELDLPVLITSGRYDDLGSSHATQGVESGFEPAGRGLSIRILSRQPW